MDWPSLSVIIPSFNQGPYIERTLRSILKQDYSGDLQIIVSDGGSTDETVEVLKKYPQVEWWSEQDGGFVDAVTKGLTAATGEIVAIQSSDDYYLEGAFRRAISVLRTERHIDFVTGNEVRVTEDGQAFYPAVMPYVTLLSPGALLYGAPPLYVPQHCTFIRRSAMDRVGGLRADVDQCADFDLWYRLLHFGRAVLLPSYLGAYQLHAAQRSQNQAQRWLKALKKVVEDAENNPTYARRFRPPSEIKRNIFLVWDVLWNLAAGGEEGARTARALTKEALQHPEVWPADVLNYIKAYASAPSPIVEAVPELPEPEPGPELALTSRPLARRLARRLLRPITQAPALRALLGKDPLPPFYWGPLTQMAPEPFLNPHAAKVVDIHWWQDDGQAHALGATATRNREMRRRMPESVKEMRVTEWNRDLYERVGQPLQPEELESVFIIIPGNSGDVALATSVVRWIKGRNPRCRVTMAVKRSNLPLTRMCPGVDEAVETPTLPFDKVPGRSAYLTQHAGRAQAVLYPICVFEDMGLLRRYNFLETIWLLSGVPDGMPDGPQRLWLTPPNPEETAARVLGRCLSEDFAAALAAEAHRQPGKIARHLLLKRTVRNAGWKNTGRLRGYASYIRSLPPRAEPLDAANQFVIVSNDANAVPEPPDGLFEAVVQFFRSQGRVVLHNVLDPIHALPGTVPLMCTYQEFLSLRQAGVPFVGWRSGLCDIAASSPAPMCVLYPASMNKFSFGLQANCETPLKSFGFGPMNVAANCLDLASHGLEDLEVGKLAAILSGT